MDAKSRILQRLASSARAPKEAFEPRRVAPRMQANREALLSEFAESLKAAGGAMQVLERLDEESIVQHFEKRRIVVDLREEFAPPPKIEEVDLAIVPGSFGVAENGAVWVEVPERMPRELLTLARALALTLPADAMVPTMEDAYERLDPRAKGYGLFMAGPSKTADIEQSLVLGAHGAMELKVFLEKF